MFPTHPIQISILLQLMYSNGLRFSDMKEKRMEGSQFTFHIDKLISDGLVAKIDTTYQLTEKGKGIAGKLDLGDTVIAEQAKVSVLLVCIRDSNQEREFLLYTRHKSPFYGFQGFPTGKVKKHEDINTAAVRELFEETSLTGIATIIAVRHYRVNSGENIPLEDKIYFVCKIVNPSGELLSGPEGEYRWVPESKIWEFLVKPVPEIQEIFEHIDDTTITFSEKEYQAMEF